MISRAACAALDHVAKEAMFSCDTDLDRWSVLGFFCAKLLSFSEPTFGLGSLAFTERQGSYDELAADKERRPWPPFLADPGADDKFHQNMLGVPHRLRLAAPPDCSFYPEGSGVDCRLQQ